MVLVVVVGSAVQSLSLSWGLLATELILILLPALLFVWGSRLDWRAVLRLRWPGWPPVLLALAVGAGVWGLDMGLQGLATTLMGYSPPAALASLPADPFNLALFAAAMMLAAPLCEETLFRGYLLSAYGRYRPLVSVLAVGLLFAFFHLQLQGLVALLPIALVLGYLAQRSRSLAPSLAAHFANNCLGGLLGIAIRLSPTLPSQPALTATLCAAMVAGPLLALAALLAFHRVTAAPAEPLVAPSPAPATSTRGSSRGTFWPLVGAGAIYLVLAALELVMGRFPQWLTQGALQLNPAPWSQPARLAYNMWNVAGEKVGEAACTLTPQGSAVAFDCRTGQSHFQVQQGNSTYAGGRYTLAQTGRWDAATMRLLEAHLQFVGEYSSWTAEIGPGADGLSLALGQAAPTALSADGVVAAEWPWRMMALPFGQPLYFGSRLNLLQLAAGEESGRSQAQALLVSGPENLPTPPTGQALAWKVKLGQQTAWYAAGAPHTLLRFSDGFGVTWTIVPPPGADG